MESIMKTHILIIFSGLLILSMYFVACEEPYTPPLLDNEQLFVVEGFVEYGEGANPTYVMVTRSIPYTSKIDINGLNNLFVKDAIVSVNDGNKTVGLSQICLQQLPPEIRRQAAQSLGLNGDSLNVDICVYIDLLNQVDRRSGGKYDLTVKTGGTTLTASTTIPPHVPLDSIRWSDPPGEPSDTLARLWVSIQDREEKDFYRYMTDTDGNGFIAPFTSVTDDAFFNGKKFEFPLTKAEPRGRGNFDPNTAGLFKRGDSLTIKWMNIDQEHFDFWNTRDFAANSGGPFAGYTRIKTNIKGGLGIWGGYSVSRYRLLCPKK
jgi:hypothetical protein